VKVASRLGRPPLSREQRLWLRHEIDRRRREQVRRQARLDRELFDGDPGRAVR
jgi:hypothetical protein